MDMNYDIERRMKHQKKGNLLNIIMHHKNLQTLGSLAVILFYRMLGAKADCLVPGSIYGYGQIIDYIGYSCLNETHWEGRGRICIGDEIVTMDLYNPCPGNFDRYCVQCPGERAEGQAACRNTPSDTNFCPNIEEPETCLVGDVVHNVGDVIGSMAHTCINGSSWEGTESYCGPGGIIMERPIVATCYVDSSYCVQCNSPDASGQNKALCLSSEETPDYCKANEHQEEDTTDETDYGETKNNETYEEENNYNYADIASSSPKQSMPFKLFSSAAISILFSAIY